MAGGMEPPNGCFGQSSVGSNYVSLVPVPAVPVLHLRHVAAAGSQGLDRGAQQHGAEESQAP
eukprot:9265731-Pyramimonas_sp.AAC.1